MEHIAEILMAKAISILTMYLEELGVTTEPPTLDNGGALLLPVFLSRIYEVYRARLFDESYTLLLLNARQRPTPGEVAKHGELARTGSSAGTWSSFFPTYTLLSVSD